MGIIKCSFPGDFLIHSCPASFQTPLLMKYARNHIFYRAVFSRGEPLIGSPGFAPRKVAFLCWAMMSSFVVTVEERVFSAVIEQKDCLQLIKSAVRTAHFSFDAVNGFCFLRDTLTFLFFTIPPLGTGWLFNFVQ